MVGLSLEIRLNVEVNQLASDFLQQNEPRQQIALLFPSGKCQLIINKKLVTQKIPQSIQFEAGSIEIHSYIMQQNLWNKQTVDNINWDAHRASYSYHFPQQCYLVRLCQGHLPLGQTLYCCKDKYPATCPGCGIEPKTQDHYLQ
jgi:hypothetical protein